MRLDNGPMSVETNSGMSFARVTAAEGDEGSALVFTNILVQVLVTVISRSTQERLIAST